MNLIFKYLLAMMVTVFAVVVAAGFLLEAQAVREEPGTESVSSLTASQWLKLEESEWRDYLMYQAVAGKTLDSMTPYEVLGIYATDPERQRRYAALNAEYMMDFYRRSMAFEELYRAELQKHAKNTLQNPGWPKIKP